MQRRSRVRGRALAAAGEAEAHFARRLAFETDCWDVHDALLNGARDFVVLDVRGRASDPGLIADSPGIWCLGRDSNSHLVAQTRF